MSEQNIYDNPQFFLGYKALRGKESSPNNLIEKPALFSLLPNLKGLRVLDLGCGYGENCNTFRKLGAKQVVGIDISAKMLAVAMEENQDTAVQFHQLSMSDLSPLQKEPPFDLIVSSLALHYIADFPQLLREVNSLLKTGGYWIFSQEHPLTTAVTQSNYWTKDEEGKAIHYNLAHYREEGIRHTNWLVEDVVKYHRSFSTIFTDLVEAGFQIQKVLEPLPTPEILAKYPSYQKYSHKPDFLLVSTKKA